MTEQREANRTVGLGIAAVAVGNVLCFMVIWVALMVGLGGVDETAHWYSDGGLFMHLVTLLALFQVATAIVLGIVHLRRPVPVALYLIAPSLTALAGIAGTMIGVSTAYEALTFAPPDIRTEMWSASLSIANHTRQFGFLAAGCGCMGLAIGCGSAAFARRGLGSPDHTSVGPILIVGCVGLVGVVVATGVSFLFEVAALPVGMALTLSLATAYVALGARGTAALSKADNPQHRGLSVTLGFSAGFGIVLATLSLGYAATQMGFVDALESIATAPPDMKRVMIAEAASWHRFATSVTLAFTLVATAAALTSVAICANGFGEFVGKPAMVPGIAVVIAALVFAANVAVDKTMAARQAEVAAAFAVRMPEGMKLASSTVEVEFSNQSPVVAFHDGGVWLGTKKIANSLSNDAMEAIQKATLTEAPDHAESDGIEALSAPATKTNRPFVAAELMRKEKKSETQCPENSGGPMGLAFDHNTTGERAWAAARWLWQGGACEVRLLVAPPRLEGMEGDLLRKEYAQLVEPLGVAADIIAMADAETRAAPVLLAGDHHLRSLDDWDGEASLALGMTLDKGMVTISGSGGTLDPPIATRENGRVDKAALQTTLFAIKDAFPEEERVYLCVGPGTTTTIQDVVDVMDAARDVDDGYDRRLLFHEVVWVLEPQPAPPFGLPGTVENVLGLRGSPGANGTPVIQNPMQRSAIQNVVNRHRNAIRTCYEKQLSKDPELQGKVVFEWTISPTGKVTKIQVAESTMATRKVERCMKNMMKRWKFPAPAGGGAVEVVYPFVFQSE